MALNILLFADYYRPGYRAGGPVQSIFHLVQQLRRSDGDRFFIVTRNHDERVESPYNIRHDCWTEYEGTHTYYASSLSPSAIRAAVKALPVTPDLVWLSSYFSTFTAEYLLLRRLRLVPNSVPVLVSPRNELSASALGFKSGKKTLYRTAARFLRLYSGCRFHATSDSEQRDIERHYGAAYLAPNLLPVPLDEMPTPAIHKQVGELRLLFFARIDGMKNLSFLLSLMQHLDAPGSGIRFDIAGPIKNAAVWRECERQLSTLKNIPVQHLGPVEPARIGEVFSTAHFLVSSTLGENFGYGILDAWRHALATIISDRTPWRDLAEKGVGWDVPLDPTKWLSVFDEARQMDQERWLQMRARAFSLYAHVAQDSSALDATRAMLRDITSK